MPADEAPTQVRPFNAVLQELRGGSAHAELGEALVELTNACIQTEKSGTLTLTIKVSPSGDGMTVLVTDDVKVKAPVPAKQPTLYFPDQNGNLSRRNPAQPELPLREIPGGASADTTTTAHTGTEG